MSKFICVTKCYWGQGPGLSRLWEVGEEIECAKLPNIHFKPVGKIQGPKAEKEYKFDDKESEDWTMDDFKLSTKRQINDKFELGIPENRISMTGKQVFITAALKKQQGTSAVNKG